MGLHHHRTAGGQGRGGVAPGHREGEGEVPGGEHDHGAEGDDHPPEVGPGPGGPVRVGPVDGGPQERSLLEDFGEEPELEGGPAQLPHQPGLAEPGLLPGQGHQLVGRLVQGVGHGPQTRGPGRRAAARAQGARRGRPAAASWRSTLSASLSGLFSSVICGHPSLSIIGHSSVAPLLPPRHRVAGAPLVPGSTAHSPPRPLPSGRPSPPAVVMKSRSPPGPPKATLVVLATGSDDGVEHPVGPEALHGRPTVDGHPQAPAAVDAHPVGQALGAVQGHEHVPRLRGRAPPARSGDSPPSRPGCRRSTWCPRRRSTRGRWPDRARRAGPGPSSAPAGFPVGQGCPASAGLEPIERGRPGRLVVAHGPGQGPAPGVALGVVEA